MDLRTLIWIPIATATVATTWATVQAYRLYRQHMRYEQMRRLVNDPFPVTMRFQTVHAAGQQLVEEIEEWLRHQPPPDDQVPAVPQ